MPRKATTRRAQGEGSIRQRPDGRWEGKYTTGRDPGTGKQIRRSVYADTQEDVRKKLREVLQGLDEGTYVKPDRMTVGSWLDTWFKVYFLPNHRASTATIYDSNIRAYLVPGLGKVQLQKLRVDQVQAFVNAQSKEKQPASVRKMIEVLRAALKQAVVNNLLQRNPCDGVTLPKADQKEIEFLTSDEQDELLKALPDTDNGRALRFVLLTGLRASELCGLRWSDVEDGHFTVRQGIVRTKAFDATEGQGKTQLSIDAPKSKAGMRVIPILPEMREILQQQRKLYASRKLAAGTVWEDGDYVFCTTIGTPKDSANLRRTLKESLEKAGLRHRGIHALRHSFATNAIRAGVDVKTLGELIGHTKAAFTIQTYVHSNMDAKIKAMQAINGTRKKP
mgnify:CR=1 FL=1